MCDCSTSSFHELISLWFADPFQGDCRDRLKLRIRGPRPRGARVDLPLRGHDPPTVAGIQVHHCKNLGIPPGNAPVQSEADYVRAGLPELAAKTGRGCIKRNLWCTRSCPPRRSVRRKRPPPQWTLHLWQPARSPLINRGNLFKQTEPLLGVGRCPGKRNHRHIAISPYRHIAISPYRRPSGYRCQRQVWSDKIVRLYDSNVSCGVSHFSRKLPIKVEGQQWSAAYFGWAASRVTHGRLLYDSPVRLQSEAARGFRHRAPSDLPTLDEAVNHLAPFKYES